jgi:type VI secretion system ImpM family protein
MRTRASCYGKLPFHREFIRVALDGAGAGWVERWVSQAHAAWTESGGAPTESPLVRYAAEVAGRLVAGVVRQSSDGLRRHPVTLFVDVGEVPPAEAWHLLPLAATATWNALAAVLDAPPSSLEGLRTALDGGVPAPDVTGAAAAYQSVLAEPAGAWPAFVGLDEEPARHAALNFAAVAEAQRGARSREEGVAVAFPLGVPDGAEGRAAVWLDAFSAAAGPHRPVLLLAPAPARLTAIYRPAEGRDLAAVLCSPAMASIDDLAEPWQPWPPADAGLAAAVAGIGSGADTTVAGLRSRLGGLAKP